MFWNSKVVCPITEEDKNWLEEALVWYAHLLGKDFLKNKEFITPNHPEFNWTFNGTEEDAFNSLKLICRKMDVDFSRVNLNFYSEKEVEFTNEGLFVQTEKGDLRTAGKYIERVDNTYDISLEIQQLEQPVNMIATLAHEVAHIKLLGERRLWKNDEYLTDLATHVWGFGIFSANAATIKMNTWNGNTHTGWQISRGGGYLPFKVHAFALALLSNFRNEEKKPKWLEWCNKEIYSTFKKSQQYIEKNQDQLAFTYEKIIETEKYQFKKDLSKFRLKRRK